MTAIRAEATDGADDIVHYGEPTRSDPVGLCAGEVAANQKLLHNGNAYRFYKMDLNDFQRNLAGWETKFEKLEGSAYDGYSG